MIFTASYYSVQHLESRTLAAPLMTTEMQTKKADTEDQERGECVLS